MLKRVVSIIICGYIIISALNFFIVFADDAIETEPVPARIFEEQPVAAVSKIPFVDATAAIVMDVESGRVLFEKNSKTKKAIASTTKIMTCIVAIENGNLEDTVKVSKKAANIWGSSIGIKEGQEFKLKELLYGLMLNSGNDAAIAIAEHIGGSVEGFAAMMNDKAREIGALNTNFKTPHGLDVEGHYSTAYDLALIARYALENKTFSNIVGTKSTSISLRQLHNTNEMLGLYPGADGVKTGYTGQAGRCLVTSATRDNWRIISVVLGCPSRTKRASSSKSILDYGFRNYKPYILLREGDGAGTVPVIKGKSGSVAVRVAAGARMPLSENEINSLQRDVSLPESLQSPVAAGETVGKIRYMLNGVAIAESDLKTVCEVPRKSVPDYLGEIFTQWQRIMKEGL